jgi:hypothetical protein
MFSSAYHP